MKRKLAEVTSCTACPFEGWSGTCTKTGFRLPKEIEIPDWCPLPDAPINAGENCFYQGGHGCNNIRLDVPWKEKS